MPAQGLQLKQSVEPTECITVSHVSICVAHNMTSLMAPCLLISSSCSSVHKILCARRQHCSQVTKVTPVVTQLMHAAELGDADGVRQQLDAGAETDLQDKVRRLLSS